MANQVNHKSQWQSQMAVVNYQSSQKWTFKQLDSCGHGLGMAARGPSPEATICGGSIVETQRPPASLAEDLRRLRMEDLLRGAREGDPVRSGDGLGGVGSRYPGGGRPGATRSGHIAQMVVANHRRPTMIGMYQLHEPWSTVVGTSHQWDACPSGS